MSHKHRLKTLECTWIEAEIARIDEYYRTIGDAELDLICAITEELQAEAMSRGYTSDEVEFYNRHVDVINGFSATALMERTRRVARELVKAGQVSQAEIDEIFEAYEAQL